MRIVILTRGEGFTEYINLIPTHEIWACFSIVREIPFGIDLVFGIDPIEALVNKKDEVEDKVAMRKEVVKRVNRQGIPIFLPKIYPNIPTSMKYPLKKIVNKFGITYFSNTVCYMIAYAIYIGVKQIDLYGVNMKPSEEYRHQKGGVEFWLGFAMGKGLKIEVHGKESKVLKTKTGKLYGYDCDENLKGGIL